MGRPAGTTVGQPVPRAPGRKAGREGAAEKDPTCCVEEGAAVELASPGSQANGISPALLPEPRAEIDGTAASLGPGWI